MKLVFLDAKSVGDLPILSQFSSFGEYVSYDLTSPDQVLERIEGAEVIITNKVVLDADILSKCPSLGLVCITATGVNNIDLEFAEANGIQVKNVSGYSTESVAQATFAMLFQILNHVSEYDAYVKKGAYAKSSLFTYHGSPIRELKGMRYGIVGMGAIGQRVAELVTAFGAEVTYYSTSGRNTNQPFLSLDLDDLLSSCDVISIHAPLNERTKGLFGKSEMLKMKKDAVLINVGRGGIVDESALAEVLDSGHLSGAGLDVFEKEPMCRTNPLLGISCPKKLVLAPHVAWASCEARETLMASVFENIRDYIAEKH